jgi:hypothetical protein
MLLSCPWVLRTMTQTSVYEAVLFFNDGDIVKEMLYSEFEAVLDRVVDVQEFASQEVSAVFVTLTGQLGVTGAVFFRLGFNAKGEADKSWNLPLRHLNDVASKGPDLGAGAIRLACRSQCPIPWHQRHMWDPVMKPEKNSFAAIRDAIRRNRLCLLVEDPPAPAVVPVYQPQLIPRNFVEPPVLMPMVAQQVLAPVAVAGGRPAFSQLRRDRAAREIKQLRLQLRMQNTSRQDELTKLSREHQSELTSSRTQMEKLLLAMQHEQERYTQLKEKLAQQAEEFQQAREQFLDQIDEVKEIESSQIASQIAMLKRKFELEVRSRIEAQTTQMKEMLDMREVELFYREEQISTLREEVTELRQEKLRLLREGGDKYIEKLHNAGLTFVAYHPGVGHITIPLDDMGRYLDSPTAYAAETSFVTEEHYRQWLEHYQTPVCGHNDGKHGCGRAVSRVDSPTKFIAGKSDRCGEHFNLASSELEPKILKIQ